MCGGRELRVVRGERQLRGWECVWGFCAERVRVRVGLRRCVGVPFRGRVCLRDARGLRVVRLGREVRVVWSQLLLFGRECFWSAWCARLGMHFSVLLRNFRLRCAHPL